MRKKSEVKTVSKSEEKVLGILLDKGDEGLTVREACSILEAKGTKWATRTVSTFLDRLEEKGFATHEKKGITNYYYPTVDREKYGVEEGKRFLETFFGSSIKDFVSAFAKDEELSEKDLEELKEWVNKNK